MGSGPSPPVPSFTPGLPGLISLGSPPSRVCSSHTGLALPHALQARFPPGSSYWCLCLLRFSPEGSKMPNLICMGLFSQFISSKRPSLTTLHYPASSTTSPELSLPPPCFLWITTWHMHSACLLLQTRNPREGTLVCVVPFCTLSD